MDTVFSFILPFLLTFLAGVGLGTFVLGARIRKVVAEAVQMTEADYQEASAFVRKELAAAKAEVQKGEQKAQEAVQFIKKEF